MKITYDPEADALYIGLRKAEPLHSDDIEEGVVADFDEDRSCGRLRGAGREHTDVTS
jgi:uncharacterized protein YuzE